VQNSIVFLIFKSSKKRSFLRKIKQNDRSLGQILKTRKAQKWQQIVFYISRVLSLSIKAHKGWKTTTKVKIPYNNLHRLGQCQYHQNIASKTLKTHRNSAKRQKKHRTQLQKFHPVRLPLGFKNSHKFGAKRKNSVIFAPKSHTKSVLLWDPT